VLLNDSKVPVTHVASEAQLTDVQFSFLLAMATKYLWTNWRALLLDDPTQHHDLVHAASVFDLLRDYIADLGFQVILATHDSVQADFFIRKLENDGLPCTLYVLEADENGVNAVLQ
jgi:ABC-type phosphonate transport system ATPase subunit